ncbi:protein phosphatase Slingshot homolog 2-like [Brachionichthys hirsutus]|uniref:protein phosphatase Slingshot homolog 2-like n=1 Tax=Brachionichthys hirsutus TaxID=412623 RepID=UPI00360500CC
MALVVTHKCLISLLISESFLTVKGAALLLPGGNTSPPTGQRMGKHSGDLQTMSTLLRPEDTIRLAVRLESVSPQVTRYMVLVSTNGRPDTEESAVLGVDFISDSCCSVGLVLPLWSNTLVHLDGDGGFNVSTVNSVHVFKPVSVQAMWSALQAVHHACELARCHNNYPGLSLTWLGYYQSRISSSQVCINEWNAMQDVESHRADPPVLATAPPTERERTERLIKVRLKEIMMQKDLENVTCKEIRTELEIQMGCNLSEFKEFIDKEMLVILGQLESPAQIFEHVYLGSEWNASNLEELQTSGVHFILNVTREIDNFFPGMFEYQNIRVYDEEATNLLEYWNQTYEFISKAKRTGTRCLVHCKMGVSRSASTVVAYAMKERGWDLSTALQHVQGRRAIAKPNPAFMRQLEEYQGILLASKQRHNKLWRSHSDGDLSDRSASNSSPHILGVAVPPALAADPPGQEDGPATAVPAALPHPPSSLLILRQRTQQAPPSHGPLSPGRDEEGGGMSRSDRPHHHDDGVSVRHIVTELEATRHAPSLPPSHGPRLIRPAHPTDPSEVSLTLPLPSPSTLSRDWPTGSVRRATEQLELKLKRELESCQRSPLPSPGERSRVRATPLPAQGNGTELDSDSEPSPHGQNPRCSDQVALESNMDERAELGAQAGHGGGRGPERDPQKRLARGYRELETAGRFRTTALQARIRRAGFTPPSLTKRSASLAKLDSLDLSTSDLRPGTAPSSVPVSQPDDSWKKPKVLGADTKTDPPEGGGALGEGSANLRPPDETGGRGSITTGRQQARGHPSRHSRKAEKKQRGVALLYGTM